MRYLIVAVIGMCMLSCTSCSKDSSESEQDSFIIQYGGKPYKGESTGDFYTNGERRQSWNGSATIALIEVEGDSVSMYIGADFGNDSKLNFKIRGKQEGLDYSREKGDKDHFAIRGDQITGYFENPDQIMQFNGKMEKGQARISAKVTFLRTSGVFPKGSELNLSFDTSRKIEKPGENDEGCQMRMVPIWSPSGMTMGMVPDC